MKNEINNINENENKNERINPEENENNNEWFNPEEFKKMWSMPGADKLSECDFKLLGDWLSKF